MVSHSLLTHPTVDIVVKMNGLPLKKVEVTKFLGVSIDNTLKWKPHIEDVKTKISKLIGVIHKIRGN